MSTTQSSTPSPIRQWLILALLVALCFTSHFNRASITSAMDERILKQYQFSTTQAGAIYSSFLLLYTLFMIPSGWFIDRRGPRLAMLCMGLGSAVFCIATGLIGMVALQPMAAWLSLLLIRSVMGILSTPLHPGAARTIGGWFAPGSQALANGVITGASVLAYSVVHPLFGALIDAVDWPKAFLFTGTFTIALSIVWYVVARDRPTQTVQEEPVTEPQELDTELAPLKWDRRLVLLTLSYAAVGYFQYLFFFWMHYYFDEILKMGKEESRTLAGLPSLAMALTMPLGGWVADLWERRAGVVTGRTLIPKIGMILSSAFLVAGLMAEGKYSMVTCFTLAMAFLGLSESSFWTTAVQLGRERGGTTAAIMNTGGNGLGLLAPIFTPWISSYMGWRTGIGFGALIGLCGALCWFWMTPSRKHS
jgi:MFS family permease